MNFSSQGKQLCIDDFKSSLAGLNKLNRWVQSGDTLPWGEIEKLYNQRLNNGKRGAGNGQLLDGHVLLREKCDGVPKGTSSCPDFCDQFMGKSRQYMENTLAILEICLLWIFEWMINLADPNYSFFCLEKRK